MKILFVTTVSNTINGFLIPHIGLLVNKGYQVDIACNVVREIKPEVLALGCQIHQIEFQRTPLRKENFIAYRKIKELVISEGYELIHTHTPIASALVRLACRKMTNVKVLYTAHGFHFYKGAPLKNWLLYYPVEKWLSRYTDCLITINKEDYRRANRFKAKSVEFINGVGVDLDRFKPQTPKIKKELRRQYGFSDKDFILFFAAELNYNKHQDLLLNVVNRIKHEIPQIKLLLAGSGDFQKQYKRQSEILGVKENVQFLGHRDDISNLLLAADIAVSSSRREGLPVNVMEAMAVGLPLVVTNCRGNRDLVRDGENGYVVEIDDVSGFVNAIERLYRSKELRRRFSGGNIDFVRKYALDSILSEMAKIYKKYE